MTTADPFGLKRSLNASIYSAEYLGLQKEEQDDYVTNTEVPSVVPSSAHYVGETRFRKPK